MIHSDHLKHALDDYVSEARRNQLFDVARNNPNHTHWAIRQAICEAVYAAEHGITIDRGGDLAAKAPRV